MNSRSTPVPPKLQTLGLSVRFTDWESRKRATKKPGFTPGSTVIRLIPSPRSVLKSKLPGRFPGSRGRRPLAFPASGQWLSNIRGWRATTGYSGGTAPDSHRLPFQPLFGATTQLRVLKFSKVPIWINDGSIPAFHSFCNGAVAESRGPTHSNRRSRESGNPGLPGF